MRKAAVVSGRQLPAGLFKQVDSDGHQRLIGMVPRPAEQVPGAAIIDLHLEQAHQLADCQIRRGRKPTGQGDLLASRWLVQVDAGGSKPGGPG